MLVLTASDAGDVPLQHLIPRDRTTLIRWYVEYAYDDQDIALPHSDVVFNAIGEYGPAALSSPRSRACCRRRGSWNHPATSR